MIASASSWRLRLLLLLGCALASICPALGADYAGRPLQDVLRALSESGLKFIYSTTLITPDLIVKEEPSAHTPLAAATEMLAQHQLELMRIGRARYAIVRKRAKNSAKAEPSAAAPTIETTELEEIIVSTSRYALGETPAAHTLITQQELTVLPQLGDETLRAVHRLPGAATNGLSGLAAIRGGEPNETLILLDGMQLFEPFHLKNFFSPVSLLDSRIVSNMDVYSGGFGARYGTRISGIIDAHSVQPEAPHYYELGASLFHTNALTAQRFAEDDGQWVLSARRSNLDEVIHVLESDVGEPQYFDVFTRLSYDVSRDTRISGAYLGSRDTIKALRASRYESAQAEYRNNYAWITLDHDWSSSSATRLIASFTDVTNNRRGQVNQVGASIGTVNDERAFHIGGLQLDGTFEAARLIHSWGVSARRLSATYDYRSALFETSDALPESVIQSLDHAVSLSPEGHEYSAYWSTRAQLGPAFTMDAGLRWDDETYSGVETETQLAPRLSAVYALSPHQRVRLSWGRFFQPQSINEAQVESETEVFFPAQRADQLIVGYETELAIGAQVRIEAYRKNYSRLRPHWENLFDPVVLVPELRLDRVLIDPDRARAEGVEVLISKRAGVPWTWWFSYSWSQVKDVIDGREVFRSWDQRHAISAGVHWANERWDITASDTYHTGWPTTPVNLTLAEIQAGARNSTRFDDFNSVDLRINRRFPLTVGEIDIFLEVTNVFNERNPCCTSFSVATTASGPQINRETNHWLGIVPSIGVLWRH